MGKRKLFLLIFLLCIAVLPILPDSNPDKNQLQLARECLDYMSYEPAAGLLQQYLAEHPKKKGVRLQLAYAYFRLDRNDEALKVLEEEERLSPGDFHTLILQAYIHFLSGRLDRAEEYCRKYTAVVDKAKRNQARKEGLDLHHINHMTIFENRQKEFLKKVGGGSPNLGLPYFILGLYNRKMGDNEEAVLNFHSALDGGYDSVSCWSQIIDIELEKNNWAEVLELCKEALAADGPKAEYHFLTGYAYYQLNELEKATDNFISVVKLKPYFTEGIKNLAKIFLLKNEQSRAASLLKRVLKLGAYDPEAHRLLSSSSNERKLPPEEIGKDLSKEWIDSRPVKFKYIFSTEISHVISGINSSALALLKEGRINAAGNLIRDFLENYDFSPELHYNLAKLYENSSDLGRALEHAWKARELNRTFKDAYDLAAGIFFQLEDYHNALLFYQKVLDFNPQDAMSAYNMGCAYWALGDSGMAERFWQNAISNEELSIKKKNDKISTNNLMVDITVDAWPVSFEAHKSLGRLYLQQKLTDEALCEYLKAIELEPENPDAYLEVGKIYRELEDEKKAALYFTKYVSLGGSEDKVKEIR